MKKTKALPAPKPKVPQLTLASARELSRVLVAARRHMDNAAKILQLIATSPNSPQGLACVSTAVLQSGLYVASEMKKHMVQFPPVTAEMIDELGDLVPIVELHSVPLKKPTSAPPVGVGTALSERLQEFLGQQRQQQTRV